MTTALNGTVNSRQRVIGSTNGFDTSFEHLSLGHLAAGLASVMVTGASTTAWAQDSQLPAIEVESGVGADISPDNTLQSDTGISRLGRVQDIPQTVTVVNQQTLKQQGVTTLDQALRNVPGVTVAIGEGNGGMNGDQFRIRGFQAKGDIYTDGLRDFGVYVRDSFAYQEVQVLKGPSSENFGMGTTGGAINNVLKAARLGDFVDVEGMFGQGPVYRGTFDVNRQLSPTSAIRFVGMFHDQEIVDRDHLFSDRWGGLASFVTGIGTDTTMSVSYLHQTGRRQPDMGQPISTPTGMLGRPVSEFGVPRSNYYGKQTDGDRHDVDMITAHLRTQLNDWLTVTNDTRLAAYDRYFAQTSVNCNGACAEGVARGNFNVAYGFGGPAGFVQTTQGVQNITTAIAKFNTGPLRHELITGVDVFYQRDERTQLANSVPNEVKNAGTIGSPLFQSNYTVSEDPLSLKRAEATDVAFFASDRVWLTEQLSVLGGVRWDQFDSEYRNTTAGVWNPPLDSTTSFYSPKASVIWEPTKAHTFYITWARSYSNLAGQFVSNENNPIGNETLKPEENDLWEAGAKLNFLGGRLGATAALFQVTKGNSIQTDPTTGDVVQTNETQRVRGVELGLTGKVTEAWTVQLAYAFMDSEILEAPAATAAVIGNRVAFVPENAASLWTTYDVAPLFGMPGKFLVGGGIVYTDSYYVNSANNAYIPQSVVLNGLISYEHKNWRVALNGYNLTDELYYDTAFGNRAVVAAGRTVMLTAGARW